MFSQLTSVAKVEKQSRVSSHSRALTFLERPRDDFHRMARASLLYRDVALVRVLLVCRFARVATAAGIVDHL
jgi:hypothetical protein